MRASYADLPALVDVVARRLGAADVTLELGPPGRVDLALLEALARLVLVARRSGGRLVLHPGDGAADVAGLAELTGLSVCLGLGLGQPDRQAEPGEQLRAEEVVHVRDPPR